MDFLLYSFNVINDIVLQVLSHLSGPRINISWSCRLYFSYIYGFDFLIFSLRVSVSMLISVCV